MTAPYFAAVGIDEATWDRFWEKVDASGDCWEWTAYRDEGGYGRFRLGGRRGRMVGAHRLSLAMVLGRWPEEVTDHRCRNRGCVNPAHLMDVTNAENGRIGAAGAINRARQLAITHCPAEHEYTPENTGRHPNGARRCRECDKLRARQARRDAREGMAA